MAKKVYTNPQAGQPLITTISTGCLTPIIKIKFCNIVNPFYFPNSPMIPRYSVTCVFDPNECKEFLKGIQNIEKNEGVESVIKNETVKQNGEQVFTGNLVIKFQGKDKIPVYLNEEGSEPQEVEMQDELATGENIVVVYDIIRYTKKNSMKTEHGINFKPTSLYYYPAEAL